jgi:hypothetical protein
MTRHSYNNNNSMVMEAKNITASSHDNMKTLNTYEVLMTYYEEEN